MRNPFRLLLFLIIFLTPVLSWAQDTAEMIADEPEAKRTVDLQFESDFYSQYVWYGIAASNGPVWQPSASVSAYGFKFTTWSNFVLDNEPNQGQFNEVDLILNYQNKIHKLGYVLGVEGDLYPYGNPKSLDYSTTTFATTLRLTYPFGHFTAFADAEALFVSVQGGLFGDLGVEFEHDLPLHFSVDTFFMGGMGNSKFNSTHIAAAGTKPNLIEYALSFPWDPVKHWTFTPTMHITHLLLQPSRSTHSQQTIVWGGLGITYQF